MAAQKSRQALAECLKACDEAGFTRNSVRSDEGQSKKHAAETLIDTAEEVYSFQTNSEVQKKVAALADLLDADHLDKQVNVIDFSSPSDLALLFPDDLTKSVHRTLQA